MESKPALRVAAYVLLVEDERILLCRLAPHVKMHPAWTLPGGGIEFGEHPRDAAIREAREETGLSVEIEGDPIIDSQVFSNQHSIRFVYHAHIIGGELTDELDESTDRCAWFSCEQARSLALVELAELGIDLAFGPVLP